MKRLVMDERDNVAVVTEETDGIPRFHKVALCDINEGESVIKYGYPIGKATACIRKGEWVHSHNLTSAVSGSDTLEYLPIKAHKTKTDRDVPLHFKGYRRKNGRVGVRNELWIVPTVGCVNGLCRAIAEGLDGAVALSHSAGCSQCGGDEDNTIDIISGLCDHPNAGAVLLVSLGCENCNLTRFEGKISKSERLRFMVAQDGGDEVERGKAIAAELLDIIARDEREDCDISELIIGLKCGGSDAMSGITANPLVGRACDIICAYGGSAVMGEVPEMFGAEKALGGQCKNKEVFERFADTIESFKRYFEFYGAPYGENPSPGNREGGITTIEEKSLGCVRKIGTTSVNDVIAYGKRVTQKGGTLLATPGNDIVAVSALAAAGAQIILFTTGRGTPLGSPVPVIKVATNTELANKKPNWIDFDAMEAVSSGEDHCALLRLIVEIASGKETASERNGYRDFALWRNGVTL